MPIRMELQRATDGTHFVIAVQAEQARRQLIVPLSPELSADIERMCVTEGVTMEQAFVDPHLRGIRHSKLS